jgi:dienelactone hydrolase
MNRRVVLAGAVALTGLLLWRQGRLEALADPARDLVITSPDGWHIYARSYPGPSKTAPVVLLFHQAGSSKAEYTTIAPRLNALGYNALAIDQRVGGDLYGPNETVAKNPGKVEPQSRRGYSDARIDLETALAWARSAYPGSRVVLWGSSYSSDLVFLVAAASPQGIAAILSFSPDPVYMGDPAIVLGAAHKVRVPVLIVSAPGEEQGGKAVLDALASAYKRQYVAKDGLHGSSTLLAAKNPAGASANWLVVRSFLAAACPPGTSGPAGAESPH